MTVPGSANPLLLRSAAPAAYQIQRSIRLNAADSASLSRNPASAGNRKTWTWAGWIKRSALGSLQFVMATPIATNTQIYFDSDDQLVFGDLNLNAALYSVAKYRDPSAWYHVVIAVDTTQATASNRVKMYVNGVQLTGSVSGTFTQNYDFAFNSTVSHDIGRRADGYYFSGYLADVHLIDGQALTPSSFTEVSATTGRLEPKQYTGSFGTNGFWLKFSDNSAATASTLGKDYSGNSNNWTPNNLAVTGSSTSTTGNISLGSTARNFYFKGLVGHQIGCASGNHVWDSSDGSSWTYRGLGGSTVTLTSTYLLLSGNTNISFTNTNSDLVTYWDLGLSVGVPNGTGTTYTWNVNAYGAQNIDSLVDTPTSYGTDTGAGGEVRGNYCTWNPLTTTSTTLSDGNLQTSGSGGSGCVTTFVVPSSGKYYCEVTITTTPENGQTECVGVGPIDSANELTRVHNSAGQYYNGSSWVSLGSAWSINDVIGIGLNADAGQISFYRNGTIQGSAQSYSFTSKDCVKIRTRQSGTSTFVANFGQRQWAYAAPAGFKALSDTNLPAPTIATPSTMMDVKLYTGNGSTQTISGLGFSPDLVWIKTRSNINNNFLFDIIRGPGNYLLSDGTNAEGYSATTLTAFNADGFSTGSNTDTNGSGRTFVAWTWDAGSSTTTNNSGSISSQVRANASAGFSIVTYTGNGSTSQTVGHGLGNKPGLIIVRSRSNSTWNWGVYHQSLSGTSPFLSLNTTNAASTNQYDVFNPANNSSTVFGIGNEVTSNQSGGAYVAYCFAPVAGYSAMGSYVGNSSADGPFVYTGFRPRFIMIKNADATTDWVIVDTARETYNVVDDFLRPNSSAAEGTRANLAIDILSNGFKQRGLDNFMNGSNTHIYAAFAESPFQYARAR